MFGTKRVQLQYREGHIFVRVGGGWSTISSFLASHGAAETRKVLNSPDALDQLTIDPMSSAELQATIDQCLVDVTELSLESQRFSEPPRSPTRRTPSIAWPASTPRSSATSTAALANSASLNSINRSINQLELDREHLPPLSQIVDQQQQLLVSLLQYRMFNEKRIRTLQRFDEFERQRFEGLLEHERISAVNQLRRQHQNDVNHERHLVLGVMASLYNRSDSPVQLPPSSPSNRQTQQQTLTADSELDIFFRRLTDAKQHQLVEKFLNCGDLEDAAWHQSLSDLLTMTFLTCEDSIRKLQLEVARLSERSNQSQSTNEQLTVQLTTKSTEFEQSGTNYTQRLQQLQESLDRSIRQHHDMSATLTAEREARLNAEQQLFAAKLRIAELEAQMVGFVMVHMHSLLLILNHRHSDWPRRTSHEVINCSNKWISNLMHPNECFRLLMTDFVLSDCSLLLSSFPSA